MALLNIFKPNKEEKKIIPKKAKEKAKSKKTGRTVSKTKEKTTALSSPKKSAKKVTSAWRVLRPPHITEKATDLTARNQYVFKVAPNANKIEIKKAIEDLYGVDALWVRIINVPPKKRRLGKTSGWRKGYKKAIIKIREGQKIEVLPR